MGMGKVEQPWLLRNIVAGLLSDLTPVTRPLLSVHPISTENRGHTHKLPCRSYQESLLIGPAAVITTMTHLNIVYASLWAGSLTFGSFSSAWTPNTI
jgi:hypothetical protein